MPKLFDKIATKVGNSLRFSPEISKKGSPLNSRAFGVSSRKNNSFVTNQEQLLAYQNLSWASIAVDRLMQSAGNQDYFFKNIATGKEIKTSKVSEKITAPFTNGFAGNSFVGDLMPSIIGHRSLTGNAYFLKVKDTGWGQYYDTVDQFIPLQPNYVRVHLDAEHTRISHYEFTMNGSTWRTAPPDAMIHFRQNTLFSPFVGVGGITKIRLTAEGEVAGDKFQNEFMERRAAPSLVIKSEEEYTEEQYEKRQQSISRAYEGKDNAGKAILIVGKGADAKPLQMSQKDIQFLETKKFSRETILSAFSVPPIVAGLVENANRSNSESQRLEFLANTINPLLGALERTINQQFVSLIDSRIEFKFERHTTGNVAEIKEMIANGIITPNGGAELLGFEANWDDELRSSYYLPLNLVPISSKTTEPPATTAPVVEKSKPFIDKKDVDPEKLRNPKYIDEILDYFEQKLPISKQFQLKYLRVALKRRVRMENTYTTEVKSFLEGQEARIMEKIKELDTKSFKYKVEGKFIDDIVEFLFDLDAENALYKKEIIRLHTAGVQGAIADTNIIAGASVSASLANPFVKQAIDKLARQSIEFTDKSGKVFGINRTSKSNLFKIVQTGLVEQENIPDLTKHIRDYLEETVPKKYGSTITWRSRMIARTESRASWDAGAVVNYGEVGVKKIDVVGCEHTSVLAGYGDMTETASDCGRLDIPLDQAGSLIFHPNHIGVIAPSLES